jgi:hypothetical protein
VFLNRDPLSKQFTRRFDPNCDTRDQSTTLNSVCPGRYRLPNVPNTLEFINMKTQIIGLRISSAIFGLVCLAHIARVVARIEIVIGHYRLGFMPSWVCIIVTGWLCIWFSQLAGPWSSEAEEPPATISR